MALIPSAQYPAQTDAASTAYPLGKARNAATFQDGSGTPLEKTWINDIWGFLQALLSIAGITASGSPDQVGASQYLDGIKYVADRQVERFMLGNWQDVSDISGDVLEGLSWDPTNELFITVDGLSSLFTSPDGVTWTSRTSNYSASAGGVVSNPAGVSLVFGSDGTIVSRSTNGTTWAAQTAVTSDEVLFGAWHSGASLFILVGENGTIKTSPTGLTGAWTARTSGVVTHLNCIASNGTIAVVVGDSGVIRSSTDGITWTARTSGVATALNGIAWDGALFVVCGASGVILTSPDGITWTARTSGVATSLTAVVATDNYVVIVGASNVMLASADGITWVAITHTLAEVQQCLAWSGFVCIAGGSTGRVSRSQQRLKV